MGLWKDWLYRLLSFLDGPTVLELGSGPGHLIKFLWQNKIKAFGLEESPQMVALARKRLLKGGFNPQLVRSIGEAIPYQDSYFDQVVVSFPAECITNPQTLREIKRVLKDNGELVIL